MNLFELSLNNSSFISSIVFIFFYSNVDNDNVRQRSAYSVDLLFVINLYFV